MSHWMKVFDAMTPWATVLHVIEAQTQIAIDDLRASWPPTPT